VNAYGTMAEVVTVCVNPQCGKHTTWFSQPNFHGTKIAAGNFRLSYGIILAGTSATKVFRALKHMGMTCILLTTFFKYQRVSFSAMFSFHSLSTIDILTILYSIVYNVNISARIHPPLKQRIPLKS
jgi:hypothetical protein